uniref:Uncharacterized protein n=1 Tax=Glossina palpalis gambiensis TaxID=67801 RepID=A0A1B0B9S2_9MUSC
MDVDIKNFVLNFIFENFILFKTIFKLNIIIIYVYGGCNGLKRISSCIMPDAVVAIGGGDGRGGGGGGGGGGVGSEQSRLLSSIIGLAILGFAVVDAISDSLISMGTRVSYRVGACSIMPAVPKTTAICWPTNHKCWLIDAVDEDVMEQVLGKNWLMMSTADDTNNRDVKANVVAVADDVT